MNKKFRHDCKHNLACSKTWESMHYSSLSLPDYPTKKTIKKFIEYLDLTGKFLVCKECGDHWCKIVPPILKKNIGKLKKKDDIIRILFDIHNTWNYELGKPKFTFPQFCKKYNYKDFVIIKFNIPDVSTTVCSECYPYSSDSDKDLDTPTEIKSSLV